MSVTTIWMKGSLYIYVYISLKPWAPLKKINHYNPYATGG